MGFPQLNRGAHLLYIKVSVVYLSHRAHDAIRLVLQTAEFVIEKPFHITDIWNYHYNWGEGTTPGNIGLRRSDGRMFGPWEVTAATTQEKIDWVCKPNTTVPPGTYTVVDSDPQSWSWNSKTGGRGMTKVKGKPVMGRGWF